MLLSVGLISIEVSYRQREVTAKEMEEIRNLLKEVEVPWKLLS